MNGVALWKPKLIQDITSLIWVGSFVARHVVKYPKLAVLETWFLSLKQVNGMAKIKEKRKRRCYFWRDLYSFLCGIFLHPDSIWFLCDFLVVFDKVFLYSRAYSNSTFWYLHKFSIVISATKTAVHMFQSDRNITPREKELFKSVKVSIFMKK